LITLRDQTDMLEMVRGDIENASVFDRGDKSVPRQKIYGSLATAIAFMTVFPVDFPIVHELH